MQSLFLKEWRYFAKVNVVSSNLIARSNKTVYLQFVTGIHQRILAIS